MSGHSWSTPECLEASREIYIYLIETIHGRKESNSAEGRFNTYYLPCNEYEPLIHMYPQPVCSRNAAFPI